jgi:hypothetical protein
MLNHGITEIIVSRHLGHAKPSITLDIYGHLIPGMQEEATRLMDELITPIEVQQLHPTAPDFTPRRTRPPYIVQLIQTPPRAGVLYGRNRTRTYDLLCVRDTERLSKFSKPYIWRYRSDRVQYMAVKLSKVYKFYRL